jgi:hypothetical protein
MEANFFWEVVVILGCKIRTERKIKEKKKRTIREKKKKAKRSGGRSSMMKALAQDPGLDL